MERTIGNYSDDIKGPLLVVIGGIHGNEHAGIKAIDLVCKMLQVEHIRNESFRYKGKFLGIVGNMKAVESNQRFIKRDLNRIWKKDIVDKIKTSETFALDPEEKELKEILDLIGQTIEATDYDRLVVLDLHTTSSDGGIFTIPNKDPNSMSIASELHATVIQGILDGLQGTTLHYFTDEHFDLPTTSITFESGQHTDPKSVNRAVSAVVSCMRSIGAVEAEDVENIHDEVLLSSTANFPKLTELIYKHDIRPEDRFEMLPGFENFQKIKAGQQLAKDLNGPVASPEDGLILMPLYQEKGDEGFFIIKELS